MSIERVTVNQTYGGRIYQNVLHFDNPNGAQTVAQIAEEVRVNWIGAIKGHQAHQLIYNSLVIGRVDTQAPPAPVTVQLVNEDGNGTDNVHHGSICGMLSFRTALAGRRNRGRYYIATIPISYYTMDLLNSNGTPAMNGVAAALEARFKTGGSGPLTLVIWHRDQGNSTPVTQIIAPQYAGIQRRRNHFVGI